MQWIIQALYPSMRQTIESFNWKRAFEMKNVNGGVQHF